MTRFFSREATRKQRGFVLVAVLFVAILYFALMHLMLIESIEAFRGAQRFRSRVIAQALAEDAAELVAEQMVEQESNDIDEEFDDGNRVEASYQRDADGNFEIEATAETSGVMPTRANVRIRGRVTGTNVKIKQTTHSQ